MGLQVTESAGLPIQQLLHEGPRQAAAELAAMPQRNTKGLHGKAQEGHSEDSATGLERA